ncbi:MAG: TlpA family protein disulfide reductase [Phycisphaerae bacterium]|nr:TlpA family protein disulfide reductase [Phycisphaerae bacterium]
MNTPLMVRSLLAAALALAPAPALAQEDAPGSPPETPPGALPEVPRPASPAGEVLVKASESIRGINSITFDVSMRGEGLLATYAPILQARVVAVRSPTNPQTWLIRISGSGKLAPDKPEGAFDAGFQEHFIEWVEPAERKLLRRAPRPQPRSETLRHAQHLRMDWIFAPVAFSKELGVAVNGKLLDDAEVDGELCRVVEVATLGPSGGTRRVYVGLEDGLVRRYDQIVSGQLDGRTVFQLSGVDAFNPIDPSETRVPVPAGFEAEAEPAPPGPTTPVAATPDATAPTVTAAPPPPPPAPKYAVPFELRTAAGETVTLDSLRGRPAVLFFWGTWSLPSQDAVPALAALRARHDPAQLAIVALAVRERVPAAAADFLQRENAGFSTLLHADATAAAYDVRAYPTLLLLSPEGQILYTVEGFPSGATLDELADKVNAALKPAAGSA